MGVTDFIDDYVRAVRRIVANASVPAVDERGLRHIAFDRFKYHIWYRVIEDSNVVYVVLINYQGRDPEVIDRRLR